ncbi:hypothetical protein [Neorhizobium sp. P12A]|uniref:hypothetical protein n=1 Tax=Neorhizobium sp. P12A TaxID=2268027 RepID=UPI0011EC46A0|nr:hypothetical protein [Neorhizobium sp. P12A]
MKTMVTIALGVSRLKLKPMMLPVVGFGVAFMAANAQADQLHFNLRLTVHDYGRLVASSRACDTPLVPEGLKQSILDVIRMDANLDDEAIAKTMDAAVRKQRRGMPGCSRATIEVARAHLNRDLTALKYSVDNQ